ncbi:MAG: 30S ribosomal protein S8 [Pirellulales bacterium]|nr:30S ribosomal protein S8 [Pirellulales bacterium]
MMMTDPIADMLTRIRNAVRVEKPYVDIPTSRFKRGIADVLKREGFIWDWKEVDDDHPTSVLRLELKYGPNGERVIQSIKRVSKPGRRLYTRSKELKPVLGGLGISIISSSKGVISDREARRDNVGGEVLCEVA